MDQPDVVIVGGGIGGLTAAVTLSTIGTQATVLERVDEPAEAGAGILLQPNGLAVLTALGLGEQLAAAGPVPHGSALRSDNGRVISDLTPTGDGHTWNCLRAIRRSRLHQILLTAAGRSGIVVRFGAEVTAARPDGAVELRWHDRVSTIAADLVVGADGVGSAVRHGGAFGARTRDTGVRYVRGLAKGGDLGLVGEYWTGLGPFGGAPVDDDTTYFYAAATARPVADAVAARDVERFRAAWSSALPVADRVLRGVVDFDDLLVNQVVRVDCRTWVDHRMVLLGDAAHAMAPTLGQGANSAIVDAAVLAIELSAGGALAGALARYTARRRPAVRRVQDRADRLTALSGVRQRWLRAVRDAGLRVVSGRRQATAGLARLVQQEDPAVLHAAIADRQMRSDDDRRRRRGDGVGS